MGDWAFIFTEFMNLAVDALRAAVGQCLRTPIDCQVVRDWDLHGVGGVDHARP